MNQQRSRRFRSVKEAKEKDEDKAELIKMLKSQNGGKLEESSEEVMNKKTWDSNAITPGTPFMFKLAACLRYWCSYKLNTDPGWENVRYLNSPFLATTVLTVTRSKSSSPMPAFLEKVNTRSCSSFDPSAPRPSMIQILDMSSMDS